MNQGTFLLWFFNCYCIICDNVGGIRDTFKQDLALEVSRKEKQRHQYFNWNPYQPWSNTRYKKNWSPRESNLKRLLSLLHLDLEGATEVDINPKGRFVSFKVTPSNDKVLCIYGPSWYSSREQLARGRFFE